MQLIGVLSTESKSECALFHPWRRRQTKKEEIIGEEKEEEEEEVKEGRRKRREKKRRCRNGSRYIKQATEQLCTIGTNRLTFATERQLELQSSECVCHHLLHVSVIPVTRTRLRCIRDTGANRNDCCVCSNGNLANIEHLNLTTAIS